METKQLKIERTPARILKSEAVGYTTEATGSKGSVKKVGKGIVVFDVGFVEGVKEVDEDFEAMLEVLSPGICDAMKRIAADEAHGGKDETPRIKVSDTTFDVYALEDDSEPLFHFSCAKIRLKPKIRVNGDGEAIVRVKIAAHIPSSKASKLYEYAGADVWITAVPAQVDVSEVEPRGKIVGEIGAK